MSSDLANTNSTTAAASSTTIATTGTQASSPLSMNKSLEEMTEFKPSWKVKGNNKFRKFPKKGKKGPKKQTGAAPMEAAATTAATQGSPAVGQPAKIIFKKPAPAKPKAAPAQIAEAAKTIAVSPKPQKEELSGVTDGRRIRVRRFPRGTYSEDEVKSIFTHYGRVVEVSIRRGSWDVVFSQPRGAARAIEQMHGGSMNVDGQSAVLSVKLVKPKVIVAVSPSPAPVQQQPRRVIEVTPKQQ